MPIVCRILITHLFIANKEDKQNRYPGVSWLVGTNDGDLSPKYLKLLSYIYAGFEYIRGYFKRVVYRARSASIIKFLPYWVTSFFCFCNRHDRLPLHQRTCSIFLRILTRMGTRYRRNTYFSSCISVCTLLGNGFSSRVYVCIWISSLL